MLHVTIHLRQFRTGLWSFWVEWPIAIMVGGYFNESDARRAAGFIAMAIQREPTFVIDHA